ncbi:hypothetical protein IU449_07515 [Nocardia higoensis]|uniref:Uncharacterized protein n=1 Tax=Nocardia higoensis TaxID=228599 RepID=A0ABS0DBW0_9NOCA|nr:hypothetical protein [Nocardia higoensis]MBF6354389.1 hypothetical protein [Nocardia higoensis]
MSAGEPSRPMANMLSAVTEGAVSFSMQPEDFVYVDRDCEYFKVAIRQIQRIASEISEQGHWGLGERVRELVSAQTVVDRFKKKAQQSAGGNNVWEVMEQHYQIVEDIQSFYRVARERIMQSDSEFAAQFTQLSETLPDRGPAERTPEQALEALGRMPGVLGDLYGSAPSATTPSLWPGVPLPGAGQ